MMYSVVLMMAADFGHKCHGCDGGCMAASCSGCSGACHGERKKLFGGHGCHGCSGCHGERKKLFGGHGCHGCNGCNGCTAPACTGCCGGEAPKEPAKTMPKGEKVPAPMKTSAPATISVTLPADARLTVDGVATRSTSASRLFVTPDLSVGFDYVYTLRAEVVVDGQTVAQSQRVTVRGGYMTNVPFSFSSQQVASR
jgi:uncharacterized protein (TIGR03000 family)